MMTSELLELYRNAILRQLAAASPVSISAQTLLLGLECAGFKSTPPDLSRELVYLEQKGLLEKIEPTLNVLPRYRLSAVGYEYLQRENLV